MTQVGSPLYKAPEVDSGKYDYRADILSLGIIVYELLMGEPLFTEEKAEYSEDKLKQLWRTEKEYDIDNISLEAMQFLQYCLQLNPKNRLMASELFQLDFIQKAYTDEEYTYDNDDGQHCLSLRDYTKLDL